MTAADERKSKKFVFLCNCGWVLLFVFIYSFHDLLTFQEERISYLIWVGIMGLGNFLIYRRCDKPGSKLAFVTENDRVGLLVGAVLSILLGVLLLFFYNPHSPI